VNNPLAMRVTFPDNKLGNLADHSGHTDPDATLAANSAVQDVGNPTIAGMSKKVTDWFQYSRSVRQLNNVRQHVSSDAPRTSSGQGTSERAAALADDSDILKPPRPIRLRRGTTFSALQEWEGYVVSISETHLVANLVNLTTGSKRADEEAEIPLEELNDQDLDNLKVGSIFRWAIGYERQAAGTKARISQIVFRQLPQWTKKELEEAEYQAADMAKLLAGEADSSGT